MIQNTTEASQVEVVRQRDLETASKIVITEQWPAGIRIPDTGLLPEDRQRLEDAQKTHSRALEKYDAFLTNRTTEYVYDVHQLQIRSILKKLLSLLPPERSYLRVLDVGCGERLFSPNAFMYFPDTELGYKNSTDYLRNRPEFKVALPERIPILEMAIDKSSFGNEVIDKDGLWAIDVTNAEDRALFEASIPNAYFDFIISTAAYGTAGCLGSKWYALPNSENIQWLEKFLNPDYGILLLATAEGMGNGTGIPGADERYAPISRWASPESAFNEGDKTYLTNSFPLEEFKFDWKIRLWAQSGASISYPDMDRLVARTLYLT